MNRNGSLKEFNREDGAEGVAVMVCGGSKASQFSSNAFDVKTLSKTTIRKSLDLDLQQQFMSKLYNWWNKICGNTTSLAKNKRNMICCVGSVDQTHKALSILTATANHVSEPARKLTTQQATCRCEALILNL